MNEVLIVSDHLLMAGAERLIYELVCFARDNQLRPTVLIANNYSREYYDDVFQRMNIRVVRTTLNGIRKLRNPVNVLTALYWRIQLRYFAAKRYQSIQVIGLYNAEKAWSISHPHRFFWHVNNAMQHENEAYPFPSYIFSNTEDTVLCINRYQVEEINRQYGENLKCKMSLFKLFIAAG